MTALPGPEDSTLCLLDSKKENDAAVLISLWYTDRGEADLICEDVSVIRLSADTLALTKPGGFPRADPAVRQLRFGLQHGHPAGLSLRQLCRMSPQLDEILRSPGRVFHIPDRQTQVSGAIQSLMAASVLPISEKGLYKDILCAYALLTAADAADFYPDAALPGNRHVRRAVMYMQAHFTEDIKAADIAAAAGIHPGHLHRLFGEQTGKSINALLRSLRIDRAKQMLLSGSLPAEAIALSAGFSSRPYFHRVFKAQTGLSPGEFRSAFNITCDYSQAHRLYYTEALSDEEEAP